MTVPRQNLRNALDLAFSQDFAGLKTQRFAGCPKE